MVLEENPFYLLGLSTNASKGAISDAADTKSFDDPSREADYEDAKGILLNVNKRIAAEITWLCGMSNSQIADVLHCKNSGSRYTGTYPNDIAKINTLVYLASETNTVQLAADVIAVNEAYCRLSADDVREIIDESRRGSGLPDVTDEATARQALKDLQESIHEGLKQITSQMPQSAYCRFVAAVVDRVVDGGEPYGAPVEDLIEHYKLDVMPQLEETKETIRQTIASGKSLEEKTHIIAKLLEDIGDGLRPVHRIATYQGLQTDRISFDIFDMVHDFVVALHNDHHRSGLAYELEDALGQVFQEDRTLANKVAEDKKILKNFLPDEPAPTRPRVQPRRESAPPTSASARSSATGHSRSTCSQGSPYLQAMNALQEIRADIKKNAHYADGYSKSNLDFLQGPFAQSYENIIEEFLGRSGYSETEKRELYRQCALIYMSVANVWTWTDQGDKWQQAYDYAKKALQYAGWSKDANVRSQAQKQVADFQQVLLPQQNNGAVKPSPSASKKENNSGCGVLIFLAALALGLMALLGEDAGFIAFLVIIFILFKLVT